MNYKTIEAFNCSDAWYKTITTIYREGEYFKVDIGSETTDTKKLNLSLIIKHPEIRPLIDDNAPTSIDYVNEYALRYLWLSQEEALDESTYTYSGRLRTPIDQIKKVIDKYVQHINDRQATMVTRLSSDIDISDPPCLTVIDTEIIDKQLHLTCYFRSWDAYGGLPSNIAGLQLFNESLVEEINSRTDYNLTTGMLVLHSKNCHIYERNFKLVESLINKRTEGLKYG